MTFTLLYDNELLPAQCDEKTISDLAIDKLVNGICDNSQKADYFIKVLSKPLTNIDLINKRREILFDFCAYPGLLSDLRTVFSRYDKMKSDWISMYSQSGVFNENCTREEMIVTAWNSLKTTSIFPASLQSYFSSISDTLSKYEVKSNTLIQMKEYCKEILSNQSLKEIIDISEIFRYKNYEDFDFDIIAKFDEYLNIKDASIVEVYPKSSENQSIFSILKSKKNKNIEYNGEPHEDVSLLLAKSLRDLDNKLSSIINSLYNSFYGISYELTFFECAIEYINYLKENNLPCCYPDIFNDSTIQTNITNLKDVLLCINGISSKNIIPNSITLGTGTDGILIKGENGAGKTTFLRSIGCAYLFTQAGIPISAEKATIRIKNNIYTMFSSAEEEFSYQDSVGRFEGEVRALSAIISNLDENSLLLLNETFQTTSFKEATPAIRDILEILPNYKATYIFVTHLTGLFDNTGQNIDKYEFDLKTHSLNKI